jgi:hypothetical protein
MRKEVVLTKDNLTRHNWGGSTECSFCLWDKSRQHLFFNCLYARFLWVLVQITFNIPPPQNIQHLFTGWINQARGKWKWQLFADTSHFVRWYDLVEMMLFLIKFWSYLLRRCSTGGHIGFAFGYCWKVTSKIRRCLPRLARSSSGGHADFHRSWMEMEEQDLLLVICVMVDFLLSDVVSKNFVISRL